MPTILVTNDDGVNSPGLLVLKRALSALGDVRVLAPERNWSASSHSKTMHKPLRITDVRLADGSMAQASSGSPTDCVALAAAGALGVVPDVVVSGINAGHNMGVDITYSGTVACAMEAVIKGIPGIAVSAAIQAETETDLALVLESAGQAACTWAQQVLAHGLPRQTLLNINVPGCAPSELRGVHITRVGNRYYPTTELLIRDDPYGRPYYWLGGSVPVDVMDDGTDVGAVANGFVSVTPISLDMTAHHFLHELRGWQLHADPA